LTVYLVPLTTAVVESLKDVFNNTYTGTDFDDLNVSIEFPMQQQDYPAIWVQYSDNAPLQRAGIDHHEYVTDNTGTRLVTRYKFQGEFSFTIAALSSLERDRLYDELVRILAFGGVGDTPSAQFKGNIEANDLLDVTFDWDVITPSGGDANPGTPWGTAEVIYEKTLTITCLGTFVSNPATDALVVLSTVQTLPVQVPDTNADLTFLYPDPTPTDDPVYDATQWH
jgi:hypothetical protein